MTQIPTSKPSIVDTLRKHQVFEGISPDCLEAFAATAHHVSLQPREVLIQEGAPAEEFLLIDSGRIAIEIFVQGRGHVSIETLGPGELVGWSWLVEPHRWHFDAIAVTPSDLIAFPAAAARELLASNHECGYGLLSRFLPQIVQRLRATRMQLLDFYTLEQ
ncbi:MAG: cyclic nucleotide-binding domain-containing protein [Planctomycetes bacterium]|nr:cyclic nucleotide-binding domain-containing protein [Planctomycetota bacterium]